jgi:hypothetical protein
LRHSLGAKVSLLPISASKIGFGKYFRLEEEMAMGTIGGATGADSREKKFFFKYVEELGFFKVS